MTTFILCQSCTFKGQFPAHPPEDMETFVWKSGPVLICKECAKDFGTSYELGFCSLRRHLVPIEQLVDAENLGSMQTLEEALASQGNTFRICTACEAEAHVAI